ncbi:MAG TPA: DUF748 domain-containing protein [Thermoanaerobaculia bacterium]|nr:DUF748 domain-containing protein [Thermoanaerobaculia bacterium]
MASTAPKPRDTPPKGFRKHRTVLGKLGHAGFHFSKHTLQILAFILGLALLVIIVSFFVDEPMRRAMEKNINQRLTGYTARISDLDFNIFGFSVTLHDVSIRQDAHPEPAVALLPRLHASVQWSELLKLKLVSDFRFDQPQIYVNRPQLKKEASDEIPLHKRGWQDAAFAVYPLKINLLQVNDGAFTYIDKDPKRPLKLTHLFFRANNVRNIRSPERVYPSPVHAEGIIFGTGRGEIDGHANFLAEPYLGFNTLVSLENVPLDYFRPLLSRSNLSIRDGFLTTHGQVEFSPNVKVAKVEDLLIDRVGLEYVHTAPTAPAEQRRVEKVGKEVKEASDKPGMHIRLDKFEIRDSTLGIVNRAKTPSYRLFLAGTNLQVTNLTNKTREGRAVANLTGRFMGSGRTAARATFRPLRTGADFDLDLKIEDTQMTAMNDLWRAYGKFDVVGGVFSIYSELKVKDGRIDGYVKPIFKDVNVYDPKQDKKKPFFKKLYEGIVEGLGDVFENRKRNEVVTVANISGQVSNPHASPWEILVKLVENAFIKAILPGFENEIKSLRKR